MVAELSTNQQHRLLSLAGVCLQNKWTKVAVAVAVAVDDDVFYSCRCTYALRQGISSV
jgi:hypothetical protein